MYVMLIGILLVNFGVLYCVRMRMKRETSAQVNSQVNAVVQQYFALSGSSREDEWV